MQTLNHYFLRRATVVYCISLLLCCVLYSAYWMPWYWVLLGIGEVFLFYKLTTFWQWDWHRTSPSDFERNIFLVSLLIRFCWLFGFYLFTTNVWLTPWEQPIGASMDSIGYYNEGAWIYEMIKAGDLTPYWTYLGIHGLSDAGYPSFLALLRFFVKDNILLTRVPNAFFDAWTVVLVYRIAKRNFDESTGRLSASFAAIMPMMVFYTGATMKESLMLMLVTWAIERGDTVIREKSYKGFELTSFFILAFSLSLLRTALTWILILAFICALILSSERVLNQSRRVIIIIVIVLSGLFFFEGVVLYQGNELVEQLESTGKNFENRATQGNTLVANFTKGMFFPILFTLPFPTMVTIEGQSIQQIQNGGYYIKNVLSFFCIFALVVLLISGEWRNNVMILAYLIGYLIVLGLSSFVQSGRFHHPALVIELILAAYGINHIKNRKQAKLFDYFLIFELLIVVFWNGFKLKGRGLL